MKHPLSRLLWPVLLFCGMAGPVSAQTLPPGEEAGFTPPLYVPLTFAGHWGALLGRHLQGGFVLHTGG
ncbi:MAG: hypothetical protein LUB83_03495, partial [Prevotellaceae bacterium]|nr:hypothetical protein [Prevotellaceae bacterium]